MCEMKLKVCIRRNLFLAIYKLPVIWGVKIDQLMVLHALIAFIFQEAACIDFCLHEKKGQCSVWIGKDMGWYCSNFNFLFDLTPGLNGLGKDYC